MTALIEKYISIERINSIANEKQFDQPIMNEFVRYLDYVLEQEDRLGFDEDDHESSTLEYVCKYIDAVTAEYKKGFSIEWAKEYSYISLNEENCNPATFAYFKVYQIDPDQALKDLNFYSELTGRDDLFIKHFCFVVNGDGSNSTPSAEEQAIEYSAIFKDQIRNGKSELFADKYATLKAQREYRELACFVEATEYEKAILEGQSELYASRFADEIAEYIANYHLNYEDTFDDELVEMERIRLENKFEHLK